MAFFYLDTCVWFAEFSRNDLSHSKAVKVFSDIKKHGDVVMVTHHVLGELLDVFKKESVVTARDKGKAAFLTRKTYQDFSRALLSLPNVRIKNPYSSSPEIFRPSFSILFKYLEGISHSDSCPICRSNFDFYESDTIDERDALHAILARALNCDVFLTFDNDFRRLENERSLAPMKIQVE